MENNQRNTSFVLAISIVLGLMLAGAAIGVGFYKGRITDRYVTVKGLAEKDVDANLAIWPITFNATSNNLNSLQQSIEHSRQIVLKFLLEAGFQRDDVSFSPPQIRDNEAEQHYGSNISNQFRYHAQATVTTRSANVKLIKKTMEKSGGLVGKGVVIEARNWETPTEFIFTSLNDIKPEMIETATKNAHAAAENFAKDSGSKVGKIRHASQGYFSIQERDRNSPDKKIVRVVTSIEYFLID
ncbi:SIMPL domain-containing protein [bacterium]|nr:SIMPL domain-containing protein [bacterium]